MKSQWFKCRLLQDHSEISVDPHLPKLNQPLMATEGQLEERIIVPNFLIVEACKIEIHKDMVMDHQTILKRKLRVQVKKMTKLRKSITILEHSLKLSEISL